MKVHQKNLSLAAAVMLFFSGAAVNAEHLQNTDFTEVSKSLPVGWLLENGAELVTPLRGPAAGQEELLQNGGFESDTDGDEVPDGWLAYYGPWNGSYVKAADTAARTGSTGISIRGNSVARMNARFEVENIVAGAEYQVSGWIRPAEEAGAASISVAARSGGDTLQTFTVQLPSTARVGEWSKVSGSFIMPPSTDGAVIGCGASIGSTGVHHFDDISFCMTRKPAAFSLDTEDIFHYAERGTGTARVSMNSFRSGEITSAKVDFAISDETGKVLEKKAVAFSAGEAEWDYSIASLVMRKEYTLSAMVTSNLGTECFTEKIYKYPRPKALGEDGTYYDENGAPFVPVIAYWPGDYSRLSEIGVTVAEITGAGGERTLEKLDALHAAGQKALISLFCGGAWMKPAGHPENISNLIEVVHAVKDHPAVFAYAVQDEPYMGVTAHMDEWLTAAYRLIRDIDEVHPVYNVECVPAFYDRAGKRSDVLAIDPYPFQSDSYAVSLKTNLARSAVRGRKPVYVITQSYKGTGFFPTADNVREQIYRAFEEGAQGIGFYTIRSALGQDGSGDADTPLYETDRWEPLTAFAEKELPVLTAYFARGIYPTFVRNTGAGFDSLYYEGWVKEGRLYLLVHNRGNEAQSTDIPLTSTGGKVTVRGFSAGAISRGAEAQSYTGANLPVFLQPQEAVLYEITPNAAINTSLLQTFSRTAAGEPTPSGAASQTTGEGNVISLPVKDAEMLQYVYDLESEASYLLSVLFRGSVSESARVSVTYCVKDASGFFTQESWCDKENKPCITSVSTCKESLGKKDMEDYEEVFLELYVPRYANAAKLSISAVKDDAALEIAGVSLTKIGDNLISNGDMTYLKETNILTGGWSAYNQFPATYGNTVEVRQAGERQYLYMTEAPDGGAGKSANARQAVGLYSDTVYALSFLYRNTEPGIPPTVCIYNGSKNGHCIEKWGTPKPEADGWTRYELYLRPLESDVYTLWLGGTDAKGGYAFDEVCLVPAQNGMFFTEADTSIKNIKCADVLQKIGRISEAKTENGEKVIFLSADTEGKKQIAVYDSGQTKELLSLSEDVGYPLLRMAVPEGKTVKVFLWQSGTMKPAVSARKLE